jgi:dihydropteroate synthase type 2
VSAEEEIARLTPIVEALRGDGVAVSVDTYKPTVMRAVLRQGVEIINDVTALRDPETVAVLRDADARVILMHSTATRARAQRSDMSPENIVERIVDFFETRLAELDAAGIARDRLILDPGMGFFLGRDPAVSLAVLRNLDRLAALGRPLCVSTSRKSFIGALLGTPAAPRPVDQRAVGTLATELWAASRGVDFIRTHDPRALRDADTLWRAIAGDRPSE